MVNKHTVLPGPKPRPFFLQLWSFVLFAAQVRLIKYVVWGSTLWTALSRVWLWNQHPRTREAFYGWRGGVFFCNLRNYWPKIQICQIHIEYPLKSCCQIHTEYPLKSCCLDCRERVMCSPRVKARRSSYGTCNKARGEGNLLINISITE